MAYMVRWDDQRSNESAGVCIKRCTLAEAINEDYDGGGSKKQRPEWLFMSEPIIVVPKKDSLDKILQGSYKKYYNNEWECPFRFPSKKELNEIYQSFIPELFNFTPEILYNRILPMFAVSPNQVKYHK